MKRIALSLFTLTLLAVPAFAEDISVETIVTPTSSTTQIEKSSTSTAVTETKTPIGTATTVTTTTATSTDTHRIFDSTMLGSEIDAAILAAIVDCRAHKSAALEIRGMVDGKCEITQTRSSGMATCRFSEDERRNILKNGLTAYSGYVGDESLCLMPASE